MSVDLHSDSLNIISLCTGGGGLDLGVELAIPSARSVVLLERESFAISQLVSAMEGGLMAPAPVWSDVTTFSGREWRGLVDGVIGGIPCQPHSLLASAPELEPAFRRVADGLASRLDTARVDRLRMLGNGVVPLQAAYAISTLATRLAARGSAGAAELVRLMAA